MVFLGYTNPRRGGGSMSRESDAWQSLIQAELKIGSKLGKAFEKVIFIGLENKVLSLKFEDENLIKTAKGQIDKLKNKLPRDLQPCTHVDITQGKALVNRVPETTTKKTKQLNPLQSLNFAEFGIDKKGNELSQSVLEQAVFADKECQVVYTQLTKRTEFLVGQEGETFKVSFNWRVRVGGTVGFRELLLPVFHQVFGVPFIPASTLKGAARAWARRQKDSQINELFGFLEGDHAGAAKVEILDAFPTRPCLSVDVATPQWSWSGDDVKYKPEPHPLLTMEQPNILIGLRPTSRGSREDVQKVKEWLEQALKVGIGSRVSSGYGRALGQSSYFNYSKSFEFEFSTQGMYGYEPPSKENSYKGKVEFRSTAIRGILRYWFRAFALAYYSPTTAQELENELFGNLSKPGKLGISSIINSSNKENPYVYSGKIYLEAENQKLLNLLEKILVLSSHIGGFGRGSRRPIHWLDRGIRGCHWVVDSENSPLQYQKESWQILFKDIEASFSAIKSPVSQYQKDPGKPNSRTQDVFDKNAQVWLMRSPNQINPSEVNNWKTDGSTEKVRGLALTLVYGNPNFKGKGQNPGNENVGGALGTPSYIWIKSVFPDEGDPYQVVTIFGANQGDRQAFAQELKNQGAMLVFGTFSPPSSAKGSTRPTPKILK